MVDIIIDSNEKADVKEYLVSSFIKSGYVPKVESLPAGDFLIYGKTEDDAVLIERKEASDFVSSLKDGRLWEQMAKMKQSKIKDRRVLIEGNPIKSKAMRFGKRLTPASIYGAYDGIFKWDTKIIWVENRYQMAAYLKNLIKRKDKPKKVFSLRSSPQREMTLQEKREYLIEGLPGIGGSRAKDVLKKFKTIKNFINNVDRVDEIPGIGKKTKKEIKKIIGA